MVDLSRKPVYRVDDVEIDVPRGCVRRAGEEVYLRQQTFQVLLYLLKYRERLVTKEELFQNIWKDAAVTDNALLQCIFDIRKTLGDDSRNPRFIKTFSKVGYRFIGTVEEIYPTEELGQGDAETRGRGDIAVSAASVTPAPLLPGAPSRLPPLSLSPSHSKLRIGAAAAMVIAVVVVGLVAVYFRWQSRTSRQPSAEFVLPQIAGKQPLAVMYFDNQSANAELDWLREGLADMLITDLSRSSKLVVLSRQQLHLLLERSGHQEADKIRLNEALEVARNARAKIVILGSFAQLGHQIRIDVQLHNVSDAQLLAAERLVVDQPEQILSQVDLLSLKLASHVGAPPTDEEAKAGLTNVMTNNLEAYRYYSLAVEKAQALHNQDATALLKKAVALDPQFAMAHARIGYAYGVTGADGEMAKPYLEKAFRLSDRLTEKDRIHITAWYAIANLDYSAAISSFREIVSRYPLEVEAYSRLARLLRGEERYEEALEIAKQGLVIDPGEKDLYNALGSSYSELGRHDEALAMFQRYVQLAPDEPNAHDSLGLGYQWAGRYAEAIQAYQRALDLNPGFEVAVIHLGNTYFQQGRYREALNQYQKYVSLARSDFERSRGYNSLGLVNFRKGNLNEAARAAKNSLNAKKDGVFLAFLVALEHDDLRTAHQLKNILDTRSFIDRGSRGYLRELYYLRGSFEEKSGRVAEAVEAFKEALRHRPLIWHLDSLEDCLANAYLTMGRYDEAIAEYERIVRLNPRYPLIQYHLAQAFERKGLGDKARMAYEQFLKDWKDADADIPEVITARQKLNNQESVRLCLAPCGKPLAFREVNFLPG